MLSLRLCVVRMTALLGVFCFLLSGCATQKAVTKNDNAALTATSLEQTTELTGIRRTLYFLTPYRAEIQQGNFVSRELVSQLKEGMTMAQVRFLLGTPLLMDMFHRDRWDYVFRLQKGNGSVTMSRLVMFFKDDRLVRFEGGDLPNESDYIARIAGAISKK